MSRRLDAAIAKRMGCRVTILHGGTEPLCGCPNGEHCHTNPKSSQILKHYFTSILAAHDLIEWAASPPREWQIIVDALYRHDFGMEYGAEVFTGSAIHQETATSKFPMAVALAVAKALDIPEEEWKE